MVARIDYDTEKAVRRFLDISANLLMYSLEYLSKLAIFAPRKIGYPEKVVGSEIRPGFLTTKD